MSVSPLGLLLAVACTQAPDVASSLAAMRLAAAGDPTAPAACAALGAPAERGDCVVTYVHAAPVASGDAGLCATVEDPIWRSECHFVRAEAWMRAKRPADAYAACKAAGPFEADCASHLYRVAYLDDPRPGNPLFAELAANFPQVPPPRLDTDFEVEAQMQSEARLSALDPSADDPCVGWPDRAACMTAAAEVLRSRWERRARKDPSIHAILCRDAATRGLPDLGEAGTAGKMLRWTSGPALDEAVRQAQAGVCGGGAATTTSAPR